MKIFTEEILNQGKSRNGFWSNKQLKALGIDEIKKGWKKVVIGKEISEENIQKFLDLKDKHLSSYKNASAHLEYKEPTKANCQILTEEILNLCKSIKGGWSIKQLSIFGITELKKGWKHKVIGEEYSIEAVNRFIQLKNKHLESEEVFKKEISYDRLGVINLDLTVEEQYNNQNWLDLRKIILQRDNYNCKICKKKKIELHVHHMEYPKDKFIWEIDQKYLVTVCKACHAKIHNKSLTI